MGEHAFGTWLAKKLANGRVSCAWLRFCRRCGLVALRNERTLAAMKAKCEADD